MKKHAYLLIAYHQFDLLKKLIGLLDDPHHDIFVHIDAKTQEFHPEDFNGIVKYSKLYFTDRTSVSWGGWSMIRCELLLLKQAKRTGEYAYYHLLSGQDLPLHPTGEIYRFFSEHEGKEFIHYIANPKGIDAKGRIAQYWLFQDRVGRSRGMLRIVQKIAVRLQRIIGIDRTRRIGRPAAVGANWFSITDSLAEYVLQQENWIRKYFMYTRCADEMFLQMLVEETPFYENLYMPNSQGDYRSCMRYIDWKRGKPYTFTSDDYNELLHSDCMFARKFDWDKDAQICLRLEHALLNDSAGS